jgi:hypothetical protein
VDTKVCVDPEETLTDEIENDELVPSNVSLNVPEVFKIVGVKPEFIPGKLAGELARAELNADPEKTVLGKVVESNKALPYIPVDDKVDSNDCNEKIEFTLCVVVIKVDELPPGLVSDNPKEAVYVLLEFTSADTTVKLPMPDIVCDVPEETNVVPNESAFVSTELVPEGSVPAPVGPATEMTEFPSDINDTELLRLPKDVSKEPV